MGYRWVFQVFSHEKFTEFFKGGRDDLLQKFIEVSTWDDYGDIVPRMTAMSESVASVGLSYDGLSEDQARDLDEWVRFAFCPDGLVEELEIAGVSPGDGLWHGFVDKVIDASRPRTKRRLFRKDEVHPGFDIHSFAILAKGRRHGQSQPCECHYLILSPEDIETLVRDTQAVLAHVDDRDTVDILRKELVDVFAGLPAGSHIYGSLG